MSQINPLSSKACLEKNMFASHQLGFLSLNIGFTMFLTFNCSVVIIYCLIVILLVNFPG